MTANPITNYTSLLANLAVHLHRTDLADVLPDWIVDAETIMNYGDGDQIDGLRVSNQETTWNSTTTANSATVNLPSDWLEFREPLYLTVAGTRWELTQRPPQPMSALTRSNAASIPRTYWIQGSKIYFECPTNAAYPIVGDYYAKIGPLATTSTNWLLTMNPDIYRQGAVACSAGWLGPTFDLGPWMARFRARLMQVQNQDVSRFVNVKMRSEAANIVGGGYTYSDFLTGS